MASLKWDQLGEKLYEHGDKSMALYVSPGPNETAVVGSSYTKGVAWNGITGLNITASGAEETPLWADDIKYGSMRSAEETGLTIEAYTSPKEFDICDGTETILGGVNIGQQTRRAFGCAFITTIANDSYGDDFGEKLHLLYNLTANPSERAYTTINDSPEAMTLSWECSSTPINVVYNDRVFKPTAHIVIDSSKLTNGKANTEYLALKAALFGTDGADDQPGTDPYLPDPAGVFTIMTPVTPPSPDPEDPEEDVTP